MIVQFRYRLLRKTSRSGQFDCRWLIARHHEKRTVRFADVNPHAGDFTPSGDGRNISARGRLLCSQGKGVTVVRSAFSPEAKMRTNVSGDVLLGLRSAWEFLVDPEAPCPVEIAEGAPVSADKVLSKEVRSGKIGN